MSSAARSVYVFGIYLLFVGGLLLGAPNTLLTVIGLTPTTEPWIHVAGIPVMAMGMFFASSARAEDRWFFRASVWTRVFAFIAFVMLAVFQIAPAVVVGFGVVDALGALWTRLSLRESPVVAEQT
jgi:hypothetical protein